MHFEYNPQPKAKAKSKLNKATQNRQNKEAQNFKALIKSIPLVAQAEQKQLIISELHRKLLKCLPLGLQTLVKVTGYHNGILTIESTDPGATTKLHFSKNQLLAYFTKHQANLNIHKITIKQAYHSKPDDKKYDTTKINRAKLDKTRCDDIREVANSIDNKELANSLRRLAHTLGTKKPSK